MLYCYISEHPYLSADCDIASCVGSATAERGETCDICEVFEVGDSIFHLWLAIEFYLPVSA